MDKKGLAIIGIFLLLIGLSIVAGGIYYFGDKIPFISNVILPSVGAQFIENPNDPNSEYTVILPSGRFICDADECIVSASMRVDERPIDRGKAVYREVNGVSYIGSPEGDEPLRLIGDKIGGWAHSISKCDCLFETGNAKYDCVAKIYRNDLDICEENNRLGIGGPTFELVQTSVPESTRTPLNDCQGNEVCAGAGNYDATFNFCPLLDSNFIYCSGVENSVSSSTKGKSYSTEEIKLLIGQSVDYFPKYPDGSKVEISYLRVKKYDLSCIPAIQKGEACVDGQVECLDACPSGYLLRKPSILSAQSTDGRVYCQNSFRGQTSFTVHTSGEALCWGYPDANYRWEDCQETNFDAYRECDGTAQFGNSQCDVFKTEKRAPSPQECFLLDGNGKLTNQHGKGLGRLACPGDTCGLGAKKGTTGNTGYQECVTIGQCNLFTQKSCAQGLIYDDNKKECVFPPENSCIPGEGQCVSSNSIRSCELVTVVDAGVEKTAWQWKKTASSCPGEYICSDNPGNTDVCEPNDKCSIGEVQCIPGSRTKYKECTRDPDNVFSNLEFRDLGSTTDDTRECKNNQIVRRTDIGCAFGTIQCGNGQVCENNICTCSTNEDSCTIDDIGTQRCSDNTIQNCVPNGLCYSWEDDLECGELNCVE